MCQDEIDLPGNFLLVEKRGSGRHQALHNWLAPAQRSLVQLRNDLG